MPPPSRSHDGSAFVVRLTGIAVVVRPAGQYRRGVMTRAVILLALVACGDEPSDDAGLHSSTTCDITTSNPGMPCERACATHHDETGIQCEALTVDGTEVTCTGTFGIEGVIGCCVVLPDTIVLRFAECE
jgi:hypothetical protein